MVKSTHLVSRYLERISVKAFRKYAREIAELTKSSHGVYALYRKDRLYYVGLAVNLRRRIMQHQMDRHGGRWDRFSLYLVRDVAHVKEIESLLLRIADPAGNDRAGHLHSAVDLEHDLRRRVRETQRAELADMFLREEEAVESNERRRPVERALKGLHGKRLYGIYQGKPCKAVIYNNGRIKLEGRFFDSPSAAASAVRKRPTNGWFFWKIRQNGKQVILDELRRESANVWKSRGLSRRQ